MATTHIKLKKKNQLLRKSKVVEVARYESKKDAENCNLPGTVYTVFQANTILKKYKK